MNSPMQDGAERPEAPPPRQDGRDRGATEGAAAAARRRKPSSALIAALAAAVVALTLLLGGTLWVANHAPRAVNVASDGEALIGGPFQLVDQDGRAVDQHVLDGRWSAVFFGYTYCPDTCPATLQRLAAAADRLGARAERFQVVFITVDPGRDTPAQMKLYLSNQGFPKRALGLTGTAAQVAEAARAYRVYYARHGTGADYTMDHGAAVYLMGPRGRFVKPLDEAQGPDAMARQIGEAMAAG